MSNGQSDAGVEHRDENRAYIIDQWICEGCGNVYDGRPAQVVDVYGEIEPYCGDCSEESE